MAYAGRPKNYFEPWIVTRSKAWEREFHFGPPVVTDPQDTAQQGAVLAWHGSKIRAEKNAEAIVWGSHMADPSVCVNLNGSVAVMDDRRIIGIAKSLSWPDKSVAHPEFAERIAACVNACAGISDPVQFIKDVRALTLSYCRGECEDPREDPRVVSLLARCIPPEELECFDEQTADG